MYRSRSATRTIPFFITLATFLIGLSLWTSTASAQHRGDHHAGHHRPTVDLTVEFDHLDAKVDHGAIHVDYQIAPRDWRTVQRAGIAPRLNLYTPHRRSGRFGYAYAVTVRERSGTLVFPARVTPRHTTQIEVRLAGQHRRTQIVRTTIDSACGTRVRVDLRRPAHRRRATRTDTVALVEACSAQMTMSDGVADCVTDGRKLGPNADRVIAACGTATHWDDQLLTCLRESAAVSRNRTGTVQACAAATHWQDDFRACLGRAGGFAYDPAPTIAACSDATNWPDDFDACLVDARRIRRDAPAVVAACQAGTHWSDDFQACLRAASRS